MAEIKPIPTDPRFQDLTGQTFGRLTVLGYVGKSPRRTSLWLCKCGCGAETMASSTNLKGGRHKQCGAHRNRTGDRLSRTAEYLVWASMKTRCNNSKRKAYPYYGGRGIKVCPEWESSFAAFLRDMGPRPSEFHTLDRIDNNAGYSPENCRWTTKREQRLNQRRTRRYRYGGLNLTMMEWSERTGIRFSTLESRVFKLGWPMAKALAVPARKCPRVSPQAKQMILAIVKAGGSPEEAARQAGCHRRTANRIYAEMKRMGSPVMEVA